GMPITIAKSFAPATYVTVTFAMRVDAFDPVTSYVYAPTVAQIGFGEHFDGVVYLAPPMLPIWDEEVTGIDPNFVRVPFADMMTVGDWHHITIDVQIDTNAGVFVDGMMAYSGPVVMGSGGTLDQAGMPIDFELGVGIMGLDPGQPWQIHFDDVV